VIAHFFVVHRNATSRVEGGFSAQTASKFQRIAKNTAYGYTHEMMKLLGIMVTVLPNYVCLSGLKLALLSHICAVFMC
jgi:hypothetical protein